MPINFATNISRFYYRYILSEKGVYGDRMAACINDSITKWKLRKRKSWRNVFYFLLKGTQESAQSISILYLFMHRSCVFQTESLFLPLASCTCHKRINTNIYFCQLLLSSSDSEKGEIEISLDCGRRTQTATKRRQRGFSSIFIRKMKTQQ